MEKMRSVRLIFTFDPPQAHIFLSFPLPPISRVKFAEYTPLGFLIFFRINFFVCIGCFKPYFTMNEFSGCSLGQDHSPRGKCAFGLQEHEHQVST